MVECTGLENQQSRKVLVGSNPTASARLSVGAVIPLVCGLLAGALLAAGCASVPGETLAGESVKREVRDRLYTLARTANPQCRQQRIANTEITQVHRDGKPAEERWTVEQCGQRLHYLVAFPPPPRQSSFSVRPER